MLLGVDTPAGEGTALRRSLLATYGIATMMYKTLVVLAIFTMVALKIHLLGIVLAVLFAVTTPGGAFRRVITYLLHSPETAPVRTRALCATGGLFVVPLLIAMIPVSLPISAYCVLQRADETTVFAKSPGFVEAMDVKPGEHVIAGAPICRLDNDEVFMRLVDFDSQLAEARIRMNQLAQHGGRHVADELGEFNYLNKAKRMQPTTFDNSQSTRLPLARYSTVWTKIASARSLLPEHRSRKSVPARGRSPSWAKLKT